MSFPVSLYTENLRSKVLLQPLEQRSKVRAPTERRATDVWPYLLFVQCQGGGRTILNTKFPPLTSQGVEVSSGKSATAGPPGYLSLHFTCVMSRPNSIWLDQLLPDVLTGRRLMFLNVTVEPWYFRGRTLRRGVSVSLRAQLCNEATKCFIRCPLMDLVRGRSLVSSKSNDVWLQLKRDGPRVICHRGWLSVK